VGKIASDELVSHLAKYGYMPCKHTPWLWKHESQSLPFCLVVDDFGIQYVDKANAEHLTQVLKDWYTVMKDWEGEWYCSITLKWDYENCTIDLSLPGYIQVTLLHFEHPEPR
jgi:hypothetical protein